MATLEKHRTNKIISEELLQHLNQLLAGYQVYYQNLRAFHWNIKGSQFFVLHVKFEEWYTEASARIDEIAERILAIKGIPLHTLEDYLAYSPLASSKGLVSEKETLSAVLSNSEILSEMLNHGIELAQAYHDEPTADMLIEMQAETQKRIWMLESFLD